MQSQSQTRPSAIQLPSRVDRETLGRRIVECIEDAERYRKDKLDQITRFREAIKYEQIREKKPWDSATDAAIAVAAYTVNRYAAQIIGTLFGTHPIVSTRGQRKVDVPMASKIEQFLEGMLTEVMDMQGIYDRLVIPVLRDGTCAEVHDWLVDEREVLRRVPKVGADGKTRYVEQYDVETVKDCPEIRIYPIDRAGVYPANAKDAESARGVYLIEEFSGDDLLGMVADGTLDADAVDALRATTMSTTSPHSDEVKRLHNIDRQYPTGQQTGGDNPDFHDRPIAVLIAWWRMVVDPKKPAQDWVFWLSRDNMTILAAHRMARWSGKRPIRFVQAFPDGESIYGFSLVEMVYDLQMTMTTLVRQAIDEASIRINSPIILDINKKDPNKKYENKPGAVWETYGTDSARELVQQAPGVRTHLELSQYLMGMVERVTGMGENQLGLTAQSSQTATESQVVEGNASMLFNLVIDRFRAVLKDQVNDILWMCYEYASNESVLSLWERLVGDGENPFEVGVNAMGGKYFFTARGTTAATSVAARRSVMREVYANLMVNPIITANPRLMYALTKKFVTEMGFTLPEELVGSEDDIINALAQQAKAQQSLMEAENVQPATDAGAQPTVTGGVAPESGMAGMAGSAGVALPPVGADGNP